VGKKGLLEKSKKHLGEGSTDEEWSTTLLIPKIRVWIGALKDCQSEKRREEEAKRE